MHSLTLLKINKVELANVKNKEAHANIPLCQCFDLVISLQLPGCYGEVVLSTTDVSVLVPHSTTLCSSYDNYLHSCDKSLVSVLSVCLFAHRPF